MKTPECPRPLFNYKDLLRGKSGSFGDLKFSLFSFSFFSVFFYLLGGSASPPLASRGYLWPPCWFSPKQSIKQIDPVHIVYWQGLLLEIMFVFLSSLFSIYRKIGTEA